MTFPLELIGGASAAAILTGLTIAAVSLRRVVPTNRVDIVQSRKESRSYGKGRDFGNVYYQIPAWVPGFGVTVTHFPESVFDVTLTGYDAYDAGRLPFLVDVMAFFRIEDSDKAAHRVADFPELLAQLKGVLQGAVRRTLAIHKLEQIMEDRTALGVTFTEEVVEQLKEWGVTTVKTIEFMDIRDTTGGKTIANIMAKEQSRIERESRVAVAENHQAADIREIEAKQAVASREQEAAQQVGMRTALAKQEVGIAEQQASQAVLSEQKTTTQRDMEVRSVQNVRAAEIARDVAVVEAERDRSVTVVNAEAEARKQEVVATGHLAAAKLDAQGVEARGLAEGAAKKAVLLADVAPQITLAQEIGSNDGYQSYLVKIEGLKKDQAVGIANADALKAANIKVIVTGGDAQSGIKSIGDLISPKGGALLGSALEGLSATSDDAAAVVAKTRARINGAGQEA